MKTPEEILDKYHHHLFYRDYVLELFKEYADQFKHPEVTDDEISIACADYFYNQPKEFNNQFVAFREGAIAMRDGKIGGEK